MRHWLSWGPPETAAAAGPELVWTTLPNTPPPVWLARSWEVRPPPASFRRADWLQDLGQVWSSARDVAPTIAPAIEQTAEQTIEQTIEQTADPAIGSATKQSRWETIADCPDRVVLDRPIAWLEGSAPDHSGGLIDWHWTDSERSAEVRSGTAAILVWRQQYDPGWWAVVSQSDGAWRWQQSFPVQRYLTGVAVGPGESQVRLIYWPTWWWLGGSLSLLTWASVLILTCRWARDGQNLANHRFGDSIVQSWAKDRGDRQW